MQKSHTFGFDDGNKMETSPQSRFVKISNQERKGSKYWGLEGRDIMGKITFSMDVNIETGTYTYVDEKTQKLYSNDPALSKLPNYAGKLPEADIKRLQKMTNRASEQIKQNRNTPTKKANLQELRNGYNRNLDTKPQPTETKRAKESQPTSKVLSEIIRRRISGHSY